MTKDTDLIDRLLEYIEYHKITAPQVLEAAKTIEALQAQIAEQDHELADTAFLAGQYKAERDAALEKLRELEAQPTARTYMDGYSDGKQWAMEQAQPEPVNAMLVEALGQAEKLEHEALVALSEATYELKVGNPYTTATDTYKANNDLIHRLDKILNLQYRDRKHAALTATQQAQPEPMALKWTPVVEWWESGNEDFEKLKDAVMQMLAAAKAARPEPVESADDPLQGAVDWLLLADGEYFAVATVQRTLRIGYNRAQRLSDIAKERAAAKGGA